MSAGYQAFIEDAANATKAQTARMSQALNNRLFDYIEAAGFVLGIEGRLRATVLLAELEARGLATSSTIVCDHIAPFVAHDLPSRIRLQGVIDRWWRVSIASNNEVFVRRMRLQVLLGRLHRMLFQAMRATSLLVVVMVGAMLVFAAALFGRDLWDSAVTPRREAAIEAAASTMATAPMIYEGNNVDSAADIVLSVARTYDMHPTLREIASVGAFPGWESRADQQVMNADVPLALESRETATRLLEVLAPLNPDRGVGVDRIVAAATAPETAGANSLQRMQPPRTDSFPPVSADAALETLEIDEDGQGRISRPTGETITLAGQISSPRTTAVAANGTRVAVLDPHGLRVWDTRTGRLAAWIIPSAREIADVRLSADGETVGLDGAGLTAWRVEEPLATALATRGNEAWSVRRLSTLARRMGPSTSAAAPSTDEDVARAAAARAEMLGLPLTVRNAPWEPQPSVAEVLSREPQIPWVTASALAGLPLLTWLVLLLWRRARLKRGQITDTVRRTTLHLETPEDKADTPQLDKAAHAFRQITDGQRRISIAASVAASARAAGFFTVIEAVIRRMPDYTVLIDRRSHADHAARMGDRFARSLGRAGLNVHQYFFERAPDQVRPAAGGPARPLSSLAVDETDRLIIVGDSQDMAASAGKDWLSAITRWPRRALLSITPAAATGAGETALFAAVRLSQSPFTLAGVETAALEFDNPAGRTTASEREDSGPPLIMLHGDRDRLLTDTPLTEEEANLLDRELSSWLGPNGYRWLQACAVYPSVNPDLTAMLGRALTDHTGEPLASPSRAARLNSLPWMRAGDMPDWLRRRLIAGIGARDGATIHTFLAGLLKQVRPERGMKPSTLLQFGTAGRRGSVSDRPFVEFMTRTLPDHDHTSLSASRQLRALLAPSWIDRLRPARILMVATAVLLAGIGGLAVGRIWAPLIAEASPQFIGALMLLAAAGLSAVIVFLLIAATAVSAAVVRFMNAALDWLRIFIREPREGNLLRSLQEPLFWVEYAFGRARADRLPEDDTRVRIFLMIFMFCVVFVCLTLGAVNAGLFATRSPGAIDVPEARADLVDRNGALLVTNVEVYRLYLDPRDVMDAPALKTNLLAAFPNMDEGRFDRIMSGERRLNLALFVTEAERQSLMQRELPGISFEPEERRVHPLGSTAAHILGVSDTGGQGVSGIELALNDEIRQPIDARTAVALSIDLRVQQALESELQQAVANLGARAATGIVVNARTGEVLAMASLPTFTPDDRSTAEEGALLNRAVSSQYEMGSLFKTFTIAAGIDTGRADMNTMFDASQPYMIGNRRISDFHATNKILSLEEVYLHSSNIGTSRMAVEMGPQIMRDYFNRLGLLDAAPIELKESARPLRPSTWDDSSLASLSFGYGIMVTPLQATAATVALVNGGTYRPLSLRRGGSRGPTREVISATTSRTLRDLMRINVLRGSGRPAAVDGLRVGGKTGSANKLIDGRYTSDSTVGTFAAVFPTDGPDTQDRYVVFILIDEASTSPRVGGFTAAPAAGRVINRIAGFLGVERRAETD